MNTIRNAIESVKGTISDALYTPEPVTPLSTILSMENDERSYRMEHIAQSTIARNNAKQVSSLISSLHFPVFQGGLNKGFKAYTHKIQDLERSRMIASKQESALRRNNARMLSSSINALGWPFIRKAAGPKYILSNPTTLLEEEERDRRIANKEGVMAARNNAALVSNLIRWDNYQRHTDAGAKRHTKNLEEKERKSRLTDKAEQERAADLAYQTSGLIRRLGWPFYVQPVYDNKDYTKSLEENERSLRLQNPHERMMAKENSGVIAEIFHAKDAAYLSEKEKERRTQDNLEQERAKDHAKRLASLINHQFDASEVERRRLLADKAQIRSAQLGAKKVADMVPHHMSISSWSINRAVERERSRKLNDITSVAFAKFNAKKVSQLVADANLEKKNAWTNELEQERIRRMHDRSSSDLSKKNARKVSKMILRGKTNSISATESERARRIADLNEQQRHRSVAKKLSDIVRENSGDNLKSDLEKGLPSATPIGQATRSIPVENLSLPSVPQQQARSIPSEELSLPAAPQQQARSVPSSEDLSHLAPAGYPTSNSYSSLPSASPVGVSSRSIPNEYQGAPVQYQQYMPAAESYPSSQIPYSLPLGGQPTYYSPSVPAMVYSSVPSVSYPAAQPVMYRSSPTSLPISYANVAPVSYFPASAPSTVPFDAAVPSHLRVMTDKDRKKMEKQASKHSRTAAREQRRAEHDLSKAEKLHFRGKDNRALKHESKAEQHNVAAKHHQAWAQELATDSLSHTLPSALPTVYRPAM